MMTVKNENCENKKLREEARGVGALLNSISVQTSCAVWSLMLKKFYLQKSIYSTWKKIERFMK